MVGAAAADVGLMEHPPSAPLPADRRLPHPERLPPGTPGRDAALAAHQRAVERGDPGYLDPVTGLSVMTAQYLWERNRCCDSGCRHCPYVPR